MERLNSLDDEGLLAEFAELEEEHEMLLSLVELLYPGSSYPINENEFLLNKKMTELKTFYRGATPESFRDACHWASSFGSNIKRYLKGAKEIDQKFRALALKRHRLEKSLLELKRQFTVSSPDCFSQKERLQEVKSLFEEAGESFEGLLKAKKALLALIKSEVKEIDGRLGRGEGPGLKEFFSLRAYAREVLQLKCKKFFDQVEERLQGKSELVALLTNPRNGFGKKDFDFAACSDLKSALADAVASKLAEMPNKKKRKAFVLKKIKAAVEKHRLPLSEESALRLELEQLKLDQFGLDHVQQGGSFSFFDRAFCSLEEKILHPEAKLSPDFKASALKELDAIKGRTILGSLEQHPLLQGLFTSQEKRRAFREKVLASLQAVEKACSNLEESSLHLAGGKGRYSSFLFKDSEGGLKSAYILLAQVHRSSLVNRNEVLPFDTTS